MQAVQRNLIGRSNPREISQIEAEGPGGSLGDERSIGIPPYYKYTTPSVIKIAIGVASPLSLRPVLVINSTPVFPKWQGMLLGCKTSQY